MPNEMQDLLLRDVASLMSYPPFEAVAEKCTRQMVRSGVLEKLARQPQVAALNIESVAFLFDDASNLLSELMVILGKAYMDLGHPVVVLTDVPRMRLEEAAKFGLVNEEEEESCQSLPQGVPNKNLN